MSFGEDLVEELFEPPWTILKSCAAEAGLLAAQTLLRLL